MLVFKGHIAEEAMPISATFIVTWGHGDIQAKAAAEYHVWVHGPATTGSVLMPMSHSANKGHTDAQRLGYNL